MTTTKTKTIRCGKCAKHLSALLDGEISGPLAEAVQAHVERCPSCAGQLARLRALHSALDDLPSPRPSEGFDGAFARKLQDAKRAQRTTATQPRWGRWRVPAFAAAAGVCAVVITVAVLALRSPPTAPLPAGKELELAMNLELLQDYDVVANLDALEDFEVVERLESLRTEEGIR